MLRQAYDAAIKMCNKSTLSMLCKHEAAMKNLAEVIMEYQKEIEMLRRIGQVFGKVLCRLRNS